MNSLYNYIYTILMFVILTTILEALLPKGNNKKYVTLVCGFLLTFIVINPIINIFASEDEIEKSIENTIDSIDTTYDNSIETISNQVYIDSLFEEGIKNDIYNIVSDIGYVADNIEIKYNKNKEGKFTDLKSIKLDIVEKIDNNDVKNVAKIDVNVNNKEETKKDKNIINENDKNLILDTLSERYKIDKTKISIK